MTMHKDLNLDSVQVLSYIIKCCAELNFYINLTKGQKLLYCCYGAVLSYFGIRLTREHPTAGKYGPVFPKAVNAHYEQRIKLNEPDAVLSAACPAQVRYLIYETVKHYAQKSGQVLSQWSMAQNSPWAQSVVHERGINGILSDDDIRRYFDEYIINRDVLDKLFAEQGAAAV